MNTKRQKRNSPIAMLIINYTNKKSGKVSPSRDEIKRRFNYLDWKDQKKILLAFLDSSPSDREWAYGKLLDYWDESFEPKVKELWEKYHETRCSWSVIRFLPLDYVSAQMDEFTGERDYYFICLRMAQNKDYVVERNRLSHKDYLALMYHTGRNISDDEARYALYYTVYDCCLEYTYLSLLEHVGEGRHKNVITPYNYRNVRLAIFYLQKLGKNEVVSQFMQWNDSLEEVIHDSEEFKSIYNNEIKSEYDYDKRRLLVANLYALLSLDEKYIKLSESSYKRLCDSIKKGLENVVQKRELASDSTSDYTPSIDDVDNDDDDEFPF